MDGNKYVLNTVGELNTHINDIFVSPTQVSGGGFMVCTNGNCDTMINAKSYHLKKWDLAVLSPYSIVQVIHLSEDFDCVMVGADINFLSRVQIQNKGDLFININTHPTISLDKEEVDELLNYKEILLKEEANETQPFYSEVHDLLLKIMLLKICSIYSSREPNTEIQQSRNNQIFNTFVFDLIQHNRKERKLEFYAQKQFITPSHLSRCVKQVSGKNASTMLINCVINNIKYRLHDNSKSIAEISEEFNFSSNSSFAQYFRKYTSITPKEYKQTIL
ncbi:MAG: AraC family transcriptional regulator [Rikenellaceae bacterium]